VNWPSLGIGVDDQLGNRLVTLHSNIGSCGDRPDTVLGEFSFVCQMNGLALMPGDYRLKLSLEGNGGYLDVIEEAVGFTILSTDFYQNGGRRGRGLVLCQQDWKVSNE
jgi:hypothetical protein